MSMAVAISLKIVREFLYPIKRKWYDLGIELDIPGDELDEIKSKNRDDYGACLGDMITVRLKFRDDPLTWGHLADALKARAINELELAEEAKNKQSVSNQAIENYGTPPPVLSRSVSNQAIENDTPPPLPPTSVSNQAIENEPPGTRAAITELSCYHGALRGVEAEEKLKQQPGDSHLIRHTDSNGEYILSVLKRGANGPICKHLVIKTLPPPQDKYSYTVEGSDRIFHGAPEMLKFFRQHPISIEINGIGEPCLVKQDDDRGEPSIDPLPPPPASSHTKFDPGEALWDPEEPDDEPGEQYVDPDWLYEDDEEGSFEP